MIPVTEQARQEWTEELYLEFVKLNRDHFAGALPRPDIQLSDACRTPGSYLYVGNVIEINVGMIQHCTRYDRLTHAKNILLHELCHMGLYRRIGRADFNRGASHGPAFAKLCNSIGAVYGWQKVKPVSLTGRKRAGRSCAAWPGVVFGGHADRVDFRESWKLCKTDMVLNRQTPAAGAPAQDDDASRVIRYALAGIEAVARTPGLRMNLDTVRRALTTAGYTL